MWAVCCCAVLRCGESVADCEGEGRGEGGACLPLAVLPSFPSCSLGLASPQYQDGHVHYLTTYGRVAPSES